MRFVGLALCVSMVLGCRPDPVRGEPCNEGDPQDLTYIEGSCPPAGACFVVLDCGAPPGCEGDEPFTWRYSGATQTWCGCDGATHWSSPDFGSIPTTRWRHYGFCEEPCRDVSWYEDRWVFNPGLRLSPVAEECGDCRNAMLVDSRCVDGPSGRLRPRECCDCASAELVDGVCIDGANGYEIAETCCS